MPYRGICSIEGCGKKGFIKPYCKAHDYRLKKYGDPLAGRAPRGTGLAMLLATVGHKGDECLIWPYAKDWAGYGLSYTGGKNRTVHNFMCHATHGPPPEGRRQAGHRCGNRACYNPKHIRWVSAKENGEDRVAHGTSIRGTEIRLVALDESKVRRIREMAKEGIGQTLIAKEFGVSRNTISAISTRRSWSWVT